VKAAPFLMFQGEAREALALYRETFPDYEELLLQEHPEGPQAGQIAMARIRVGGLEIMLYDSPPVHAFTFTPATSIFIDCDDEAQLRALAEKLGKGGGVMMPVDNYGFSALFTWLADRFGVSWQLNLPAPQVPDNA
jgi:predicted 3-demethylubiquinone-9 3-methyltransferase (glyoxalase superfamily)